MPPPGVKARIDRFWRALKRISQIKARGLENFTSNEDLVDAGERNLQVAVEALIDVGEFLIARMNWRTPKSYRDIGVVLGEGKVLSSKELKLFEEAVKLRNVLIHNYVYMAAEEVYQSLERLETGLNNVMCTFLDFMEKQGLDP
ncbi:MAG: hypothetical protein AYL30_001600 [Candidatus Hecatellales archaeon B24]|nr:MAG: hypothetical protein AYL30_001600 [Candidatus Hecatellales archaeon B24]